MLILTTNINTKYQYPWIWRIIAFKTDTVRLNMLIQVMQGSLHFADTMLYVYTNWAELWFFISYGRISISMYRAWPVAREAHVSRWGVGSPGAVPVLGQSPSAVRHPSARGRGARHWWRHLAAGAASGALPSALHCTSLASRQTLISERPMALEDYLRVEDTIRPTTWKMNHLAQ